MTGENLIDLALLFFAYAFLGWCIELTLKYFQLHRFINRGFLTGPRLPIYGSGAALITIAVEGLSPLESSVGTTFVVSFILCGVIEYMLSGQLYPHLLEIDETCEGRMELLASR